MTNIMLLVLLLSFFPHRGIKGNPGTMRPHITHLPHRVRTLRGETRKDEVQKRGKMSRKVETVIIGGGQGGLSTRYYLTQAKRDHVVLEKSAQAGNSWRNGRWDSFTLVTPNWAFRLPGAEYQGKDPDGFMPRDEVVTRFERYISESHLPVEFQVEVTAVEMDHQGGGYRVQTDGGTLSTRNVVIATGLYQRPKIPTFGLTLHGGITQVDTATYRNPAALPPGAVLVVGSGQSGSQIAKDLAMAGRKVYLCVGSAGRIPRRYRGRDIYEWMNRTGFLDRTADQLPSPGDKFKANPQVSGRDGGQNINLHQFCREGITLLGRIQGGEGNRVWFARDLRENLSKSDQWEAHITRMIDQYIEKNRLDAPEEKLPEFNDGYQAEEITELDLEKAGITTIVWALGYHFNYRMVKLPIFDQDGFPVHTRGATCFPGVYFIGMQWMPRFNSGHLIGVGRDAKHLAGAIRARMEGRAD